MASSEAEPKKLKLGVSDHASHARTGGGGEGETKKPTKRSDFSLDEWVSVLCCGATVPACASIIYAAINVMPHPPQVGIGGGMGGDLT